MKEKIKKNKYFLLIIVGLLIAAGTMFNSDYEKKTKIEELNKTITKQKTKLDSQNKTISDLKTALTLNVTNGSIAITNADGSSIVASGDTIGVDSDTSSNSNSTTNVSSTSDSDTSSTSSKTEEESIKKGLKKFHLAFGKNIFGNNYYYTNIGIKMFKMPFLNIDINANVNIESDFRSGYGIGVGLQGSF